LTMHAGTLGLIHFMAALFTAPLLIVAYRLIRFRNQDPVARSFRYFIIGLAPVTLYHLIEGVINIGHIKIEANEMVLDVFEHLTFIFLIIMMVYGIKLVKTETYDKLELFGKKIVKNKAGRK